MYVKPFFDAEVNFLTIRVPRSRINSQEISRDKRVLYCDIALFPSFCDGLAVVRLRVLKMPVAKCSSEVAWQGVRETSI
jgi:hypothetical protein